MNSTTSRVPTTHTIHLSIANSKFDEPTNLFAVRQSVEGFFSGRELRSLTIVSVTNSTILVRVEYTFDSTADYEYELDEVLRHYEPVAYRVFEWDDAYALSNGEHVRRSTVIAEGGAL